MVQARIGELPGRGEPEKRKVPVDVARVLAEEQRDEAQVARSEICVTRRYRKADALAEHKEQWGRIRKFKAATIKSNALGNEARGNVSGGGEVPNSRQADHGCHKAGNENVEAIGVVQTSRKDDGFRTLHEFVGQHAKNCKALPGFTLWQLPLGCARDTRRMAKTEGLGACTSGPVAKGQAPQAQN